MKPVPVTFPFLLLLILSLLAAPSGAAPPPGGTGWITFTCNVDGASVYLDGVFKGAVAGGSLDVPDGPSYSTYTVKKDGYSDVSGNVEFLPGGPPNIEIPIILELRPPGSGKGWFTVHANVDGASVAFNGVTKGTAAGGVFSLEVATTGTPYTTYRVSKPGYYPYDGTIPSMPADGQTIDLYATLNPVPTPTTTTTTVVPIGGDAGWFAIHCNIDSASVYFDSAYKGTISGGVLSVPVYTTGTPYSAYRVERSGYVPATGSLPAAPSRGQTKDVYVTLNPVPATVPVILGGDKGYYVIHCNVDGASVAFDGTYQGVITRGILTVQVATTGTPYRTFEVSSTGYMPFDGVITSHPAKDQTVDLYATLTPAPTGTITSAPTTILATTPVTYSPLPPLVVIGALAIAACVAGAAGIRKS